MSTVAAGNAATAGNTSYFAGQGTVVTSGGHLYVHSTSSASSPHVDTLNDGATVTISCEEVGTPESGPEGSTSKWYKVNGEGFASAAFIKASGTIGPCSGPAPGPSPSGCISTATATSRAVAGAKGQYEEAVCGSHSAPGYGPYRCDCSGLASYAWGYPAPGFTTSGMAGNVCTPVSWSDLRPADAILHPSQHVEIFVKWITEGSSFERAGCHNTKEGCSSGTADISYYKANGYEPCRPVSKLVC